MRENKDKDKQDKTEQGNDNNQYDYPDDLEEDGETIFTKENIQFLHDIIFLSHNKAK